MSKEIIVDDNICKLCSENTKVDNKNLCKSCFYLLQEDVGSVKIIEILLNRISILERLLSNKLIKEPKKYVSAFLMYESEDE